MENNLYDYSPIVDRPKITWPNGARIAFYVGLNLEHFPLDKPAVSLFGGTAMLQPDPLNYGWRDYGLRVGVWRMMETLDAFHIRASVLLNSDCCSRYPQVIAAGRKRNWVWCAHGRNNATYQANMTEAEERASLAEDIRILSEATGHAVRGYLGPGLTETFNTPRLLKELGLTYVLDWCADDQPFALNVPGMISVPYAIELNDITLFVSKSYTGEEFYQMAVDQFDQLYKDAEHSGRVMSICLHPFVIGQPFRHKYLEKALQYITSREGVWVTTSDEIAARYLGNGQNKR